MAQKRPAKSRMKPKTKKTPQKRAKVGHQPARSRRPSKRSSSSPAATGYGHALELGRQVFRRTPLAMARSLKRSAERSTWRKVSVFQSAMSRLNVYANRAGRNLPASLGRAVHRARQELRKLIDRQARRA